jgi:hypothetical protein
MSFQPTYLYIKRHALTGLKYFGKTISNPLKYNGSGKYWKRHIKIHGVEHIETLWYELFTDQEDCKEFALFFSEEMNIVRSEAWANFRFENGTDGGASEEHLKKMQLAARASPNYNSNPEHQQKLRDAAIASPNHPSKHPELQKNWYKGGNKASHNSPNHPSKRIVTCPHCNKTGNMLSLSRCHFDRCKHKL